MYLPPLFLFFFLLRSLGELSMSGWDWFEIANWNFHLTECLIDVHTYVWILLPFCVGYKLLGDSIESKRLKFIFMQ